MKKLFVFFCCFVAMIFMISCGGNNDGWGEPCKENIDLYYCDGDSRVHYLCVKGVAAYTDCYNPNTDKYEYSSFCYKTDCHSGCDENTGKCVIECIEEQYKCNDSSIYECDDDGQWDISWWHCTYGCATEEVSTSFIGLCADE